MKKIIMALALTIGLATNANAYLYDFANRFVGEEYEISESAKDQALSECTRFHAARMKDPDSFNVISHRVSLIKNKRGTGYNRARITLDANALNGFGGRVRASYQCMLTFTINGDLSTVVGNY